MLSSMYAKLGIALVIFLFGIGAGCSMQAKRDKGLIAAKDRTITANARAFKAFGNVFAQITANTESEVAKAERQQAAGELAGKAAEKGEVVYRDKLVYVDREIQAAMKSPTCRAQLEAPLCVSLH